MSTPLKKSTENALTLNEILWKYAKPSRITLETCLSLKNSTGFLGFTPKEFHNFSPTPPKELLYFLSYPLGNPQFFALPLKNSTAPQLGGRGGGVGAYIKCNCPMHCEHVIPLKFIVVGTSLHDYFTFLICALCIFFICTVCWASNENSLCKVKNS